MRRAIALLLLCACGDPTSAEALSGPCDDLCTELVESCGYAAFPSSESCAQGCAYSASEGADIDGHATCVQDAACNTFEILECEHAFGS